MFILLRGLRSFDFGRTSLSFIRVWSHVKYWELLWQKSNLQLRLYGFDCYGKLISFDCDGKFIVSCLVTTINFDGNLVVNDCPIWIIIWYLVYFTLLLFFIYLDTVLLFSLYLLHQAILWWAYVAIFFRNLIIFWNLVLPWNNKWVVITMF